MRSILNKILSNLKEKGKKREFYQSILDLKDNFMFLQNNLDNMQLIREFNEKYNYKIKFNEENLFTTSIEDLIMNINKMRIDPVEYIENFVIAVLITKEFENYLEHIKLVNTLASNDFKIKEVPLFSHDTLLHFKTILCKHFDKKIPNIKLRYVRHYQYKHLTELEFDSYIDYDHDVYASDLNKVMFEINNSLKENLVNVANHFKVEHPNFIFYEDFKNSKPKANDIVYGNVAYEMYTPLHTKEEFKIESGNILVHLKFYLYLSIEKYFEAVFSILD